MACNRAGRPQGRVLAFAAALILLASSPCLSGQKVTLALRWDHQFQFAGYYAAQWKGYYRQEGLDVRIVPAIDQQGRLHSSLGRVAAGRAQFGIVGADILLARDRGEKLVVLACIFQHSAARFYCRKDEPIDSLSDLTKLRIARRPGDLTDIEFRAMLAAEGIDVDKLNWTPHDLSKGYFHDMITGRVDLIPGYCIGSPYEARRVGLDLSELRPTRYGVDFYGDSLVTTESFYRDHPEQVEGFVRATLAGWRYALEHREQIRDRIAQEYNPAFPLEDFEGFLAFQTDPVAELIEYPLVEIGHINQERWRRNHALLAKAGLVAGPFPEKLFWRPDRRGWLARHQLWLLGGLLAAACLCAVGGLWIVSLRRTVRRRTAELAESRQRFKARIENQNDLIVEYDTDCRLIYVSPSYCRLFDLSEQDVLGKSFLDLVDPEDWEKVRESIGRMWQPPHQTRHEERVLTRQGTRWLSWSAAAILDQQGQPKTFVAVGRDITLRIQAEQALRESEVRFRAIADYTNDWENWIGPDRKLRWVNPAVERITGYSADECMQMEDYPLGLIHPDDRQKVEQMLRRADSQPSDENDEIRILTRQGQVKWVSVTWQPIFDPQGRCLGHRSSLREITAGKEAQLQLAEREKILRQAQRIAGIGSWRYTPGAERPEWSEEMFRITGLDPQQGEPSIEDHRLLLSEQDWQLMQDSMKAAMEGNEAFVIEVKVHRPDQTIRTVVARGEANFDESGEVVEVVGTLHDITQRKELEERLAETEKLESLAVLAGGVAHDFNNLLVGVLGNADLLREDLPASSPLLREVEEIIESARQATVLTGKMLAFSGRGQFVCRPIDVNELIQSLQPHLRTLTGQGVSLQTDLAETPLKINGDEQQIRQMLAHLVSNAAEAYGNEEGVVVLRTSRSCLDRTFFQAARARQNCPPGHYVLIEVTDAGEGMKPQTLERLFEPFFSTRFTGRGLGMPAVLGIVRGHHGDLQVISEPGHGTTVRVALPCPDRTSERPEESQPEQIGSADESDPHRRRILLVDDEPSMLKVAGRMLEKLGMEVVALSDSREAMALLGDPSQRIDSAMFDLSMPNIDGLTLLESCRKMRPEIPAILTSGFSRDAVSQQIEGCSLAGFVQKPFSVERIRDLLSQWFELPAPGR